ncbi:DUF222 domain-containing protein [Microbacterium protaetiae]|nr:DUF222 domain-containing protein [Microbacterium protaetiae]
MSSDAPFSPTPAQEPGSDGAFLQDLFEESEEHQYAANRREARRAELLADALAFARTHPWTYVDDNPTKPLEDPEAADLAERCAALEAGSRLCLSENTIRSVAATATVGRRSLPYLWRQIREGFASIRFADAAITHLPAFDAQSDPHLLEVFDRAVAEIAMHATIGSFRKKAERLARTLAPLPEERAHKLAMNERRVVLEEEPDQMAWLHIYTDATQAHAVFRTLTSHAKHCAKNMRDGRTRDQLRADLFSDIFFRRGDASLVKTKVFVTVPLDRLTPAAQATVRAHTPEREGCDLNREPLVAGERPIDASTARQILLDEGAFTRVITDPVTGVILDMDRRSRKVTKAQRAWLTLQHGTCTRDGCTRLAIDADVDHFCMYHGRRRGPTNIANLHPFCDPDHAIKDTTKVRHRRRSDRSVQQQFRSGHCTNQATRQRLRDIMPDDEPPPF